MQCPDNKEGGEVGVTLMIARSGLNLYDVAQEDTEDGGDLNLTTTTIIIAITIYWGHIRGRGCTEPLTCVISVPKTTQCGRYSYCPHFTNTEIEAWKRSYLFRVTEMLSSRASALLSFAIWTSWERLPKHQGLKGHFKTWSRFNKRVQEGAGETEEPWWGVSILVFRWLIFLTKSRRNCNYLELKSHCLSAPGPVKVSPRDPKRWG